jgi:hypothetical protein
MVRLYVFDHYGYWVEDNDYPDVAAAKERVRSAYPKDMGYAWHIATIIEEGCSYDHAETPLCTDSDYALKWIG